MPTPLLHVPNQGKTLNNQRPVVETSEFRDSRNVVVTNQDPKKGSFSGVALPDWRNQYEDVRASTPVEIREMCLDLVIRAAEQGIRERHPSFFSYFKRRELVNQVRRGLEQTTSPELQEMAVASTRATILAPENEALPKVVPEFFRRVLGGAIRPPSIDLDRYSSPTDGEGLMQAIRIVYRLSGLPRLSHAFGISDFLANEGGAKGFYAADNVVPEEGHNFCSRSSIPVASRYAFNHITGEALYVKHPFIPANMRCVSDINSARAAIKSGLCPIVSYTRKNANARIRAAEEFGPNAFITVRSGKEEQQIAREILKKGGHICLEMANANMPRMVKFIRELKAEFPSSFIMVGNVGSAEGYWLAVEAGADAVKLGRGPGAGCTTPEETGISPGQISLLYECAMVQLYMLMFRGKDVPMCLDGGLSSAGHLVLGGLFGAETFMMGSKFAVAKESPAQRFKDQLGQIWIRYFGEASPYAAMLDAETIEAYQEAKRKAGQGTDGILKEGGSYEEIVSALVEGLQGGVADLGVRSLGELVGTMRSLFARLRTAGSQRETATRLDKKEGLSTLSAGRYDLGLSS